MQECFNIQNSNSVIYNIATTKNKNHMIFSTDVVKAFESIQQAFITKKLNRLGIISPYEKQYLESQISKSWKLFL